MNLEEEVSRLNDRISEAAHGVQSISMTSIPPDFFDEERDKVFQLEIVQDSLAERVDRLIKKSTEVDARLDIIEEEMEEQTKISINGRNDSLIMTHQVDHLGVTPEKAKVIAQDENKKLQVHLENVLEEMKLQIANFEIPEVKTPTPEPVVAQLEVPEPAKPAPEAVLLKSAKDSLSSIEIDDQIKAQINEVISDLKEQQMTNIENEETIQLMTKRISALEGGNAGVLGLLERVNEVESA